MKITDLMSHNLRDKFIRFHSVHADRYVEINVDHIVEIRPSLQHPDGFEYVEVHTATMAVHVVWVGEHEPDAPTHRAIDLFWLLVTEGEQ
jgi:alpha-D-ribose 1-methylphosphonate 5-triphosphate diphosphatase PhnM